MSANLKVPTVTMTAFSTFVNPTATRTVFLMIVNPSMIVTLMEFPTVASLVMIVIPTEFQTNASKTVTTTG